MAVRHPEPAKRLPESGWTFITNHAAILLHVARHPTDTIREIGDAVGIRERSAARILRELRDEGYVAVRREGRRNVYVVNPELPLRHHVGEKRRVSDLLKGLVQIDEIERASRDGSRSRGGDDSLRR